MRVFISHSSRTDAFATQVRDAVAKGLAGHEVLVDAARLEPGDEWRSVLYDWLAECDAAVILLNREALASDWVHREASILLWRRALGEPLRIIPAVLGDVSAADVARAGFAELAEIELARLGQADGGQPADPAPAGLIGERASSGQRPGAAALAGKIVAAIGTESVLAGADPRMAKWAGEVASLLGEVRSREKLVAAARELRVEEASLNRVRDPLAGCRFLAHQFLAGRHGDALHRALAEFTSSIPADGLLGLIGKVGPTWVDEEAARALLGFSHRQAGIVLLNALHPDTAGQYVDRATCCASSGFRYEPVTAVAGETFLAEFERDCAKAVAKLLDVEPPFTIEEAIEQDDDASRGGENGPPDVRFLIVDPATTPLSLVAEGVRRIRERYPWLVVVLLTGKELPADVDLAGWRLDRARKLEPALASGAELRAARTRVALKRLLPRAHGYLITEAA